MSKVVMITNSSGSLCSGEQIKGPSDVDYVLTAAHCKVLVEDGVYRVTDESNGVHYVHLIAEDAFSDLLLLEGIPNLRGLDVAKTSHRFQHVSTYTHGSGLPTYKTSGVLIGDHVAPIPVSDPQGTDEIKDCVSKPKYTYIPRTEDSGNCVMTVPLTFSTAFISPGSSGGPVVDRDGKLVGVVSAGGRGYALFVTTGDINNFLRDY